MLKGKWKSHLALAAIILLYLATMGITVIMPVMNAFKGWGIEKTAVFLIPLMFILLVAVVVISGFRLAELYGPISLAIVSGVLLAAGVLLSLIGSGFPGGREVIAEAAAFVFLLTASMAAMFVRGADRKAFTERAIAWGRALATACGCALIALLMTAEALVQSWFGVRGSILAAGLTVSVVCIGMLAAGIAVFARLLLTECAAGWADQRNDAAERENTAADFFCVNFRDTDRKETRLFKTMLQVRNAAARNGVLAAGGVSG